MDPDLQKALTNLVVVVITILGAALTTWWQNKKTKTAVDKSLEQTTQDTDAAFMKLRAHEEVLGIKTTVTKGEINVARTSAAPTSINPEPLRTESSR